MTNTYDDMGRVKRVTEPGLEKNYTYDVAGNRESFETKVLGNVKQDLRYTYDKRGNMTEVSAPGTGISATYSYDENGNMTRELSDVYSDTDYTYNRDNTVSEISTFRIISSEKLEYTHYHNGNIKTEVSSKRENGNQVGNAKTTTYEYDAQNRLSKETVGGSVMTYTYDNFGNRATKTVEDSGALQQEVSYTYDDANRLKKTVEEQHNTYETYTTYYQYDANGNLVLRSKEMLAMTYNESNLTLKQNDSSVDFFQFNDYGEMTSAYVNGKKSTYSYRPDGLRINKTVDGVRTRHVLDGQNVSMDLNDDWSTKFSFIRGVRLVGYIDGANGSKYFYNFNAHGDVLGAVGGLNSTAQTRYTYDAFGNSSKTGTSENPFGYFGQYHDAETGLIYLRARYYDPNEGRFISEDTHWSPKNMIYGDQNNKYADYRNVLQSINLYVYCVNNPVFFRACCSALHRPTEAECFKKYRFLRARAYKFLPEAGDLKIIRNGMAEAMPFLNDALFYIESVLLCGIS